MKSLATWSAMLTLSAALHIALVAGFLWLFAPRPVEQHSAAPAEMALTTLNIPRQDASEQAPATDPALSKTLPRQGIGTQPIPRSDAAPVRAETTPMPEALAAALPASETPSRQTPLPEANSPLTPALLAPPPTTSLSAHSNQADTTPALVPSVDPLAANAPAFGIAQPLEPANARLTASAPMPDNAVSRIDPAQTTPKGTSLAIPTSTAISATPQLARLRPASAIITASDAQKVPNTPARQAAVPSEPTTAVLAWSGNLALQIPQGTIDTAAALRVPTSGADADGLRDALANHLDGVNCARVQTIYDPETGAINLRGHVKNDADRVQLLDALAQQLGDTLPIQDRLQELDAPQCNVLVQLAKMPLPQSVEQLTNPLIIGADLQTRTYRFNDGQSMTFDLAGADYDGWVYLDYFDNEGQVLHLIPNEFIPPLQLGAKAPLTFGGGGANDPSRGKFEMRVSAPFGQDIAVAMVSNYPLFDAVRPTVELAEPYLQDLAARVEILRSTEPDFKGEWVYLFVETRASQ